MIEVTMLGTFSIIYDGKELAVPGSISNKSVQLLLILWDVLKEGISRGKLLDMLYGNEDISNPAGSFRAAVFRLRKILAMMGLPEGDYIKNEGRIYHWDQTTVEVSTDAARFSSMAEEGLKSSGADGLDRMLEACRLYKGEFLKELAGEDWVEIERVRYQDLYFACLRKICPVLTGQGRYQEVYEISRSAAAVYPYEEWFLMEIDSLMHMNRYQDAMKVYQDSARLIFDEMGLMPSDEMVERFREMSNHVHYATSVFSDVQEKLAEKERVQGAYYCSLPSFLDCYRLLVRMVERSGQSVFLMLCTLTGLDGVPVSEKQKLTDLSERLSQTVEHSLRRGDLFTRYSANQFIMLLPGTDQESCSIISERIETNFKEQERVRGVRLTFFVVSAAEVASDGSKKKIWFQRPCMELRSKTLKM